MLLVFHPLCNRVVVSLWLIVSQLMFVKVYISVKVQLKCITVNTPHLSFPISFIDKIYTLHKLNESHHIFIISISLLYSTHHTSIFLVKM